jgi:hypothetical protein
MYSSRARKPAKWLMGSRGGARHGIGGLSPSPKCGLVPESIQTVLGGRGLGATAPPNLILAPAQMGNSYCLCGTLQYCEMLIYHVQDQTKVCYSYIN